MASPSRSPIMAANWKMFKTPEETADFFAKLRPLVAGPRKSYIVVAVPCVCLPAAVQASQGMDLAIAGQNVYWEKEGAFTGEISARMLRAVGASYVIIGHSERRQYFGETDETVNKRVRAALDEGLVPIVCVGETLAQREAGQTNAVLKQQFERGLWGLGSEELLRCVIAYEPVWAIGTGKTATPAMAQEAHQYLRSEALRLFGEEAAAHVRILYGGSVKPDNVTGLMAEPDVDGGLVGDASLKPDSFASLINY